MQLIVKTLTGSTACVKDVTADTTIEQLKDFIVAQLAIPKPRQKIFYAGKQLLDGTLREAGVLDGDFVVVMSSHHATTAAAAPSATPMEVSASNTASTNSTTGASLSVRKSGAAVPLKTSGSAVPTNTPSKPPATAAAALSVTPISPGSKASDAVANSADQLKSHFQSLLSTLRAVPPSPPLPNTQNANSVLAPLLAPAPAANSAAASPNQAPPAPQITENDLPVDAYLVQQLVDMGFAQNRARKALLLNRMNFGLATNWLLEHNEDADIDSPLTAAQLDQIRPRAANSNNAPSAAGNPLSRSGSQPPNASSAGSSASSSTNRISASSSASSNQSGVANASHSKSGAGEGESANNNNNNEPVVEEAEEEEDDDGVVQPNPVLRTRLQEMGFGVEDINNALKQTNNNYEAACAWLLGDRDEVVEDNPDAEDDANDNPLSGLDESNPIVSAILNNPTIQRGMTPRVISAFQTIFQNPASAAQYANDPEIAPLMVQIHAILNAHKSDNESNNDNNNSSNNNNNNNSNNSGSSTSAANAKGPGGEKDEEDEESDNDMGGLFD